MNDNIFDLYVDYLLSSFGAVTATTVRRNGDVPFRKISIAVR